MINNQEADQLMPGQEVDFDHHAPEYAVDWMDTNRVLRDGCPVAHTDAHGGFWVVSRYDDVSTIARDDVTFSSEYATGGVTIPPAHVAHIPIEMDPPEFPKYRHLLNKIFAPRIARDWAPRIDRWAEICVDRVVETGRIDLVDDLANAVPALFTCEYLGLPPENWRRYAEPMHRAIYTPPGPERESLLEPLLWMHQSVQDIITERRAVPADDAITFLTQAEIDDEPLDDETIGSIVSLIMAGGFDTTTACASAALHHLYVVPEHRARLLADPELLPSAVEEFLRYFTPTQALARTVATDTEVAGQPLREGERVLISWASANHDERAFDDPDEIVLDRSPNRHVAFGVGAHRCLGSHFARAEITSMIRHVLDRIPDYELDLTNCDRYTTIGIVNGWIRMPATFEPQSRRLTEGLPDDPQHPSDG